MCDTNYYKIMGQSPDKCSLQTPAEALGDFCTNVGVCENTNPEKIKKSCKVYLAEVEGWLKILEDPQLLQKNPDLKRLNTEQRDALRIYVELLKELLIQERWSATMFITGILNPIKDPTHLSNLILDLLDSIRNGKNVESLLKGENNNLAN